MHERAQCFLGIYEVLSLSSKWIMCTASLQYPGQPGSPMMLTLTYFLIQFDSRPEVTSFSPIERRYHTPYPVVTLKDS
jgi:hypothetical protein